jgi:hypothetical protein
VGVKANLTYQILVSTASASTTITATIEIEDASLEVSKLSSGTGNSGKVLTAASAGAPTWESPAGGISSCPSGYTLIGTSGQPGAFCVSTKQTPDAPFLAAIAGCHGKNPSANLCTLNQWVRAHTELSGDADWAGYPYYWVSELNEQMGYAPSALKARSPYAGSNELLAEDMNTNLPYRCCLP